MLSHYNHCSEAVTFQRAMLLYSPFPYLSALNPPTTTRCRLRLLPLSPSCLTSAAAAPSVAPNKDFMVDYLVDSLEFSRNEAISASTQVNHFKSSTKPELVLNCLQKYGFNKTQIREIVSSSSKILSYKVDKTLEPKIKFLIQDIGFSVSDIVMFIKKNPRLLSYGLDTCIIPTINYLKEVMGSDEKVVQTIRGSPLILASSSSLKRMQLNVEMLKSYDITDEKIRKFIIQKPRGIILNPERMEEVLSRVHKDLGIDCDSPMFLQGVHALASVSKGTMDKKIEMFKRFGWTDSDIAIMSKHQPRCLNMSEDKIHRVLNFLMKELGYTSEYLATRSTFMNLSMDKRLKPRYAVLKALRENKLRNAKPVLYSVVFMPESKFLEKYVSRYKDRVPNLYEIYKNNMKE